MRERNVCMKVIGSERGGKEFNDDNDGYKSEGGVLNVMKKGFRMTI